MQDINLLIAVTNLFAQLADDNPLVLALKALAAGGGMFIVGMLVSVLSKKSAWFQSLDSDDKSVFMIVVNALIGITSTAILIFAPPDLLERLTPFFISLIASISPYVGSQVMHALNKPRPNVPEVEVSGTVEGDVTVNKTAPNNGG